MHFTEHTLGPLSYTQLQRCRHYANNSPCPSCPHHLADAGGGSLSCAISKRMMVTRKLRNVPGVLQLERAENAFVLENKQTVRVCMRQIQMGHLAKDSLAPRKPDKALYIYSPC